MVKSNRGAALAAAVVGLFAMGLAGPVLAADEKDRVLTPEELAEKEGRKACKIQICNIFRSKQTSGDKIDCHVKKSWREADIKDMVTGGKIGWRWGGVKCNFDLDLTQAELAKAVTAPEYDLKVKDHTISCLVDRKKEGQTHKIAIAIAPEVSFKDGKAVTARVNWGKVEAPLLFKSLIWPGVKLDNQVNVVGKKMVKMVNGFMTVKCDQIKDELVTVGK